jgi:hypothetical protein
MSPEDDLGEEDVRRIMQQLAALPQRRPTAGERLAFIDDVREYLCAFGRDELLAAVNYVAKERRGRPRDPDRSELDQRDLKAFLDARAARPSLTPGRYTRELGFNTGSDVQKRIARLFREHIEFEEAISEHVADDGWLSESSDLDDQLAFNF